MTARRATLAIALGAGLLIRLAALPLPGAGDVDPWKVWAYHAVTGGVTTLYGTGSPPGAVPIAIVATCLLTFLPECPPIPVYGAWSE